MWDEIAYLLTVIGSTRRSLEAFGGYVSLHNVSKQCVFLLPKPFLLTRHCSPRQERACHALPLSRPHSRDSVLLRRLNLQPLIRGDPLRRSPLLVTRLGALFEVVVYQFGDSPPILNRIFFLVVHLVKACVMATAIALEAGRCFDGVDHEAKTWAGSGDHG